MHRILLAMLCLIPPGAARALDLDTYGALLRSHTREVQDVAGVRVDYAGLRGSSDWAQLLESIQRSDPAALRSRDGRLAYWINVYNVFAIDLVVKNEPRESIKDLGSLWRPVWKLPAGRIGSRSYSLDEIEHEILRPMGDPRVHGAIVCASLSCPPLAREPYRAETLSTQLDANLRQWLGDPRKGVDVDEEAGVLRLSRIFNWFEEDFAKVGGVLEFVKRYVGDEERRWLERHGKSAPIRYLDYDWSLNRLASRV